MTSWNMEDSFPPGLRHTPQNVGAFEVQSDEWLDARKAGIGASDSPSILAAPGAFSTCLKVWAQKIGNDLPETISERTAEMFHFGQRMESLIADELRERTGYEVRPEPRTLAHPDESFIQANLDGWVCVDGVWGPAEFKNVGTWAADQWLDEVPLKYQVQIQHQMYVVGAEIAVAAALVGGNQFLWATVERNDEFISTMVEKLSEFWGMVEENIQPMASGVDVELLKQLVEIDDTITTVLPFEAIHWAAQISGAKEKVKEWTAFKREAEAKVLQEIGDAACAELPDNSGRFTITVSKKGTKTLRYKEEK
jgi:putative phage-type endonuclease